MGRERKKGEWNEELSDVVDTSVYCFDEYRETGKAKWNTHADCLSSSPEAGATHKVVEREPIPQAAAAAKTSGVGGDAHL